MTEISKLQKRLDEMQANGLQRFSIFKGDKWEEITPECRAAEINKALDNIESGRVKPATSFDENIQKRSLKDFLRRD